ncbi:isocitrate lyase/PEP mutase family protein [Dyella jiangningensis]|uniref:Phosphonomutase n=1 Tax=Dyella jiangningensis TaxID=1379159 RepID=A0A328P726_9GAMM|nr:isocitrate lyase/phosphoenolpyruvate mutase family protein [Dyella jiangningensis]RAO76582.1 phosphonomutase [Dyella jiangningensis]
MNREQRLRAERFHQLHAGPQPLMLPNAWDAASARIIENAGAQAIATTSAGMAWALGHADGERLPVQDLLTACGRICQSVDLPVSVDIERGYGRDANDTGGLVGALLQLGVVGINIEDGMQPGTRKLSPARVLAERIACARAVAQHQAVPLFINARIDTYLADVAPASRYEETERRALAYIDAGADGIFVPGLSDPDEIARLARRLPVPLNVYAGYAGAPAAAQLRELGVRRISLGCGPMQSVLSHLQRIAQEALAEGRYDTMGETMLTVSEANGLFTPSADVDTPSAPRVLHAGMGDGPVALLLPRRSPVPDHARSRPVELTTRNGLLRDASWRDGSTHGDTPPAWRRFMASLLGERSRGTEAGTR